MSMRSRAIGILTAGFTLTAIVPAIAAPEYGAQNIYSTVDLSWGFNVTNGDVNQQGAKLVGYACVISDQIRGVNKIAVVKRYELRAVPRSGSAYFVPLKGVTIGAKEVREFVPTDNLFDLYDKSLEWDRDKDWYVSDSTPSAVDRACIDGGIAAATKAIKTKHGIN
jgi:hypothetical protein